MLPHEVLRQFWPSASLNKRHITRHTFSFRSVKGTLCTEPLEPIAATQLVHLIFIERGPWWVGGVEQCEIQERITEVVVKDNAILGEFGFHRATPHHV